MGAAKEFYSPTVFEYEDYRLFLKDYYEHQKATTSFFSYRYFSKKAGFSSPNFLKLVIEGARNLSSEGVDKFSKALQLTSQEKIFFRALVEFNQEKDIDKRARAVKVLMKSQVFRTSHSLSQEELNYYMRSYYVAMREMVGLKGFKEDYAWIANHFRPRLRQEQVEAALADLVELGLLERDADGNLIQAHVVVQTSSEVSSSLVADYHKEMIRLGSESIDRFAREEREISGTCFTCSKQDVEKFKNMVREFRKQVLVESNQSENPDCVYQLNFQLFPMAKAEEE